VARWRPSSKAVEFEALADTEFVLGSAAPHEHDLVLGYYSVHTTPDALRDGEAHISAIKTRLAQQGRL
jgi:hypothetical protein